MNTNMKELNLNEMEQVSGGDITITTIFNLPLPKPVVIPDFRPVNPFLPIIASGR